MKRKPCLNLNDQKVSKWTDAAILADEFMFTHKILFSPVRTPKVLPTVDVGEDKCNSSFIHMLSYGLIWNVI